MNNYDPMMNYGYNMQYQMQNNNWNQSRPFNTFAQPMQPRPNTNAIFVTSLEEALIKTDQRNSDMIYFNQDKNEFYRIKVDLEGRKSWAIFTYTAPNQEDNAPVTKADLLPLIVRIEALEGAKETKLNNSKKKKEVAENAESDG